MVKRVINHVILYLDVKEEIRKKSAFGATSFYDITSFKEELFDYNCCMIIVKGGCRH